MSETQYDVIVVGGGPAGSASATWLAREGFAVLLLDRATFPRDKPCGEFFSPPVRGLLTRLGAYEAVLHAGVCDIPRAILHCGERKPSGGFIGQAHPWSSSGGFSIERRVLDVVLWRHAAAQGAIARNGVSVRGLLRNTDGRVVGVRTDQGDFTARLVIGADGVRSRVARDLGLCRPIPRLQKVALVTHYEGLPSKRAGTVEMFVSAREQAVCGFGTGPGGTANVTLVVAETEARRLAALGAGPYADILLKEAFPEVVERLRGGQRGRIVTCGTQGHIASSCIADGALLVGDAACFIDPFTGEGVYFALRGAEIAAEVVVEALRRGDTSVRGLMPYAQTRQRELVPKYRVCDLVEWAVHQPALMCWIAPKLERNPRLMERILAVTGDMESPNTLLSPRVLWELAVS